jgi:hypothetical protein
MKDDTWTKKTIRTALHDVRCVKGGLASDGHWMARHETYGVVEADARKHLNTLTVRDSWPLDVEMQKAEGAKADPVALSGRKAVAGYRGFVEFVSTDGRAIWVPWHQQWTWSLKGCKVTAVLASNIYQHRLIIRDKRGQVVSMVMACCIPSDLEILPAENQ